MNTTAEYAQRHPAMPFLQWQQGQFVSPVGFGCYRVADSVPGHASALQLALTSGINLIDTSTNYTDGASEKLVGNTIQRLIHEHVLQRSDLVIVTKAGYLQGSNYSLALEREKAGNPFPDMTKYAEGLWHCIHPQFLENQITRSLERLRSSYIDVLLLHNPEYFLGWSAKNNVLLDKAQSEFYRRIELAFRHLELEAERGRINSYGISSNTFPIPASSPDFCSLETVWNIANSIAVDHRFRVIQLPMNLLEPGAATERNQTNGTQTALEFATDRGLQVLINRPLNAITASGLVRLADISFSEPISTIHIGDEIERLVELETEFQRDFAPTLKIEVSQIETLRDFLGLGSVLREHWQEFTSYERWNDIQTQYLLPRLHSALKLIDSAGPTRDFSTWRKRFLEQADRICSIITDHYAARVHKRSQNLKQQFAGRLSSEYKELPLSQLAINAVRATAGVSGVLVGMRSDYYVRDVLQALSHPAPVLERRHWAD